MTDSIYKISPVILQNLYISLYGAYWKNRRYGGCFLQKIEEYKLHEAYSEKEWENYQEIELRNLLKYTFKNVPFYQQKYSDEGFKLNDFENFKLADLKSLPILEKEDLRKYGKNLLLSKSKDKGKFYSSSGSTGTPIEVYLSKKMHQSWSALYEVRVRNWANLNFNAPRAMIGGRRVLQNTKLNPPYFRYNYFEKQAYFSAYHISKDTTIDYVLELEKVKSEYLVGYAMSIYLLAKNINNLKINAPKLKAVLTSSEKLTKHMRETIELAFKCKVFDAYSGIEACGLISENEFGELLFSPDSGILEVINKKGESSKLGEVGEVISTGFLNYDQPLIRYRIGDQVILEKNQKTKSGVNFPKIKEIYGRNEDVIVGNDGREMVRFHGVFINIDGLIMAQVLQISYTQIVIKLVVDSTYNINSEKQIITRIKSQLSGINVTIKYVEALENTKNGKYKAVISKLKNE
ncbi:MAG: hypothetical protein R3342_01375 [Lutibacter sp.]|nr:hypothetical protein [Lutibacter sp.]